MKEGIYEELVTKLVTAKLGEINRDDFYIKESPLDKSEAALILGRHLGVTIQYALGLIKGEKQIATQIQIANKLIQLLIEELQSQEFEEDIIEIEGKILKAVFAKLNSNFSDLDLHLDEITPYTRLIHSDIFTGGHDSEVSLESELRKEILSSDRVDLLVSFIKWKGIIILEKELQVFAARGGHLRVITTTYMGASEQKAINLLSSLPNSEVKISYNTGNERLHAKAYFFYRNSGFHTAYVGSSNFSRTALTDGLEWNVKITTREVGHLLDKFQKTFESYWQSDEFELYDLASHATKLSHALKTGKTSGSNLKYTTFFDIKPYPFQSEILEKLRVERETHSRYRNLIVAATGTGKTIISAFDFKAFLRTNPNAKLLFVAHRLEILEQAMSTFQAVLKDNNFGELWVDGHTPDKFTHVFASVMTLNNQALNIRFASDFFDYIIVDEVHHITASSYRSILENFSPKILLGLTATPERMDNANILDDFCDRIAAEIRLAEALNRRLLCPFQYFGLTDSTDLSDVRWQRGKYNSEDLTKIYTANDRRVGEIINNLDRYTKDPHDVRALGYCVSILHAQYMTAKFLAAGFKAASLTSDNIIERERLRGELKNKTVNYLFVVDIFNEGVDIPEIDTVLFLRPTESLTVFLQQLGRGLRLSDEKDCLVILDFVGNARSEYNFENKFRAMIGKSSHSVKKEIENNFPHLPIGCSIILERQAKEYILQNITSAISPSRQQLISKIRNFEHQFSLPLTLRNFLEAYSLPPEAVYKRGSWKRLCVEADKHVSFECVNEKYVVNGIKNKWLSTRSSSYFRFVLKLCKEKFLIDPTKLTAEEQLMLLMVHYDFWPTNHRFPDLQSSMAALGENRYMLEEMTEVLTLLSETVETIEVTPTLGIAQPLKIHGRYTRDQILVAFGLHKFEKASPSYGVGVVENKELNIELLFIDLEKSEEDYSPTTRYIDYVVDKNHVHWQSQNQTRSDSGKGLSYLNHKIIGKTILLFVRETRENEHGNTVGYVFLGEANFQKSEGSKPINILWQVQEPIPPYFLKEQG